MRYVVQSLTMVGEFEKIRDESQAFQGVSRAFEVVCPHTVSEDPAQMREAERVWQELLIETKQHIWETRISKGDFNFDPVEAIRGYLCSFGL